MRNSRPWSSTHRVSPPGLDSRRSTTPSSHPNPAIRSRHCSLPQRSANVSQSPPAQMETRNSKSPPPTKSSQASSSATTSLPWPQPSTSTSSCIFHRSKGTRAASSNCLQPSQRYLSDGNLMTSQSSMMATPFSRTYTQGAQDTATVGL